MTNEEGEGRRDKILDMEASTNGYGRGRECREKKQKKINREISMSEQTRKQRHPTHNGQNGGT